MNNDQITITLKKLIYLEILENLKAINNCFEDFPEMHPDMEELIRTELAHAVAAALRIARALAIEEECALEDEAVIRSLGQSDQQPTP